MYTLRRYSVLILLLFGLFSSLFERNVQAEEEYYTVQIGSYDLHSAEKQYARIEESMASGDRDYLRIEIVQGYHTLRIGRFENKDDADSLLHKVRKQYPGALVLSAYIKNERITRIWGRESVVESPTPVIPEQLHEDAPSSEDLSPVPGEVNPVPPVPEKEPAKEREEQAGQGISDVPASTPVAVKRELKKNVVTTLSVDEQGKPLHYPSSVFTDNNSGEIFVVVGGSRSGGVIFGPDYLPEVSLGAGRDVVSSVGGFIDNSGNLYLCQQALGDKPARLSIYNSAFFMVKEIFFADLGEEFTDLSPKQAAVSPVSGNIYLAGSPGRGVLVLDRNGGFLRWLEPEIGMGRAGQKEKAGIDSIVDVYIDSSGDLYLLSEETSSVYIYSPLEEFLQTVGEKGGVYGKLSRPRGVAVDRKRGLIYVVDYLRHSVIAYDMAGIVLAELGGRGLSPGWFNFPTDLAVDRNHHLIIADFFNQRVQVWEIVEERAVAD